jgi:hypothetical protein
MPVVVSPRSMRKPPRSGGPFDWNRVLGGVFVVCAIGYALYSNSGRSSSARSSSYVPSISSSVDQPPPQDDSFPPTGHTVKGNISVTNGARLYHVPGMRDYEITVIDPSRGERWFRTEAEAQAAGWVRADRPRR